MKSLLTIIFLCSLAFTTSAQTEKPCDIMKDGKFKVINDEDPTGFIIIEDGIMMDYGKNGDEFVKSTMVWLQECQYELTLVETNIPGFAIERGTKLKVEIIEVEGNEITFQFLPAGKIPPSKVIKISENSITEDIPHLDQMEISEVVIF